MVFLSSFGHVFMDFENEVIYVEKQLVQTRKKGQKYRFGTLKNGKTRVSSPIRIPVKVAVRNSVSKGLPFSASNSFFCSGASRGTTGFYTTLGRMV